MRILKRIVEMVFIFLVPLMLLLFGLKINKVYDENNNLISQYLTYENGIFREYNDNIQYENILNFNNTYNLLQNNDYDYDINNYNIQVKQINTSYNFNDDKYIILDNRNTITTHKFYLLVQSDNNDFIIRNYYTGNTYSVNTSYILNGVSLLYMLGYNSNMQVGTYELKILFIDLTLMFGDGYEPSTTNDIELILNEIDISYLNSNYEIKYYTNDIISSSYLINYTWYNNALISLSEHLQFNNNFMIQFMFIYIILIFMNLLLWYVFYVPFDMLFGLLLRKLEYYK